MSPSQNSGLRTVEQAAAELGISATGVYHWLYRRKIDLVSVATPLAGGLLSAETFEALRAYWTDTDGTPLMSPMMAAKVTGELEGLVRGAARRGEIRGTLRGSSLLVRRDDVMAWARGRAEGKAQR